MIIICQIISLLLANNNDNKYYHYYLPNLSELNIYLTHINILGMLNSNFISERHVNFMKKINQWTGVFITVFSKSILFTLSISNIVLI